MDKCKLLYVSTIILLVVLLLFKTLNSVKAFKLVERFVSACSPVFEPSKWNKKYVQASHNCYSYSMNQVEPNRVDKCRQIINKNDKSCGQRGPTRPKNYNYPENKKMTCESITRGVLNDVSGASRLEENTGCPNDKYKVALFIDDKNKSYHFLRKDKCDNPEGIWSHKNVTGPATQKDVKGNLIYDPANANLKYSWVNYDTMCDYLCIPDDNYLREAK